MIGRTHGLTLSLLLGTASVAGAYAVMGTAHLGAAATKPEVATNRAIAKRAKQLDAWEASLQKSLASRPPALPAVPRYARVAIVGPSRPAALPAVAAAPSQPAARSVRRPEPAGQARTRRHEAEARDTARQKPVVVAAPPPVAPPAAAAAAAAVAPVATTPAPPKTLSLEQQCEALKRAAEGRGEAAKAQAEQQCEALKQTAEENG